MIRRAFDVPSIGLVVIDKNRRANVKLIITKENRYGNGYTPCRVVSRHCDDGVFARQRCPSWLRHTDPERNEHGRDGKPIVLASKRRRACRAVFRSRRSMSVWALGLGSITARISNIRPIGMTALEMNVIAARNQERTEGESWGM